MAEPSGWHESLRTFLILELGFEARRSKLPLKIHPGILCKLDQKDGRRPDLIVINRQMWIEATRVEAALSIPPDLTIEIVSTNWEDDYQQKAKGCAAFGVQEYWIVDPLEEKATICTLQAGLYNLEEFRNNDRLQSPTFPELNLTVAQILSGRAEG